jgi:hypothetical protein
MMPAVTSPTDSDSDTGDVSDTGDHVSDTGGVDARPLRLRPPRHQVDRRAVGLWSVHAGLTALALVAAVTIAVRLIEPTRAWWPLATGVAAVAGVVYAVAMPRIRYRVHRWEVTDDAVYTKAGWLTHEWRVAPLSRVQTVDARRGPLQQVFGLASVRITTASAAGDVTVDGLDHALAADLVQALTRRTQATPGDAT